jgi:hypothetical protein
VSGDSLAARNTCSGLKSAGKSVGRAKALIFSAIIRGCPKSLLFCHFERSEKSQDIVIQIPRFAQNDNRITFETASNENQEDNCFCI